VFESTCLLVALKVLYIMPWRRAARLPLPPALRGAARRASTEAPTASAPTSSASAASAATGSGAARIRSQPLGAALPPLDPHAIGASLPQWADVVGYEEGDPRVHTALRAGYPRFVYLQGARRLFERAEVLFAAEGEVAVAAPSARAALRIRDFVARALALRGVEPPPSVRVHDLGAHGAYAITLPREHALVAKSYWQHCGELISSRHAEAVMQELDRRRDGAWCGEDAVALELGAAAGAREALCRRVAEMSNSDPRNTFLYPTGMAAISAAHRCLNRHNSPPGGGRRAIMFGFPYLDTLKLLARPELGGGVIFLGFGDEGDFDELERVVRSEPISGVFMEFPTNPLLLSPDMARMRQLADEFGFPIVIDDTIGGQNVDVLSRGGADVVCTSLTKQFSGTGNVMGGSLTLAAHSAHAASLHRSLAVDHEELLFEPDAAVLLEASLDCEERMARVNATAEKLADFLAAHPNVRAVHYPKFSTPEFYHQRMRPGGGYGGLLSIILDAGHSERMFDALDVPKGPGFGTRFTLVGPYTMLAHYHELEWAETYGVSANLVRVWVGLESADELIATFKDALE